MEKTGAYVEITVDKETLLAKISGEIDHHTSKMLRMEIDRRISDVLPKTVKIDLSGVSFMDSSGLGLILGRSKSAKNIGADFVLLEAPKRIQNMFDMSGFDRLIKIERKI